MDEITPEELINDLKYIQQVRDPRLLILLLHLYVEHFVQQICREKRIKEASVKKKADKLLDMKLINDQQLGVIKLVYDLRNELLHHLHPDIPLLERWIQDFKPDMQSEDAQLDDALDKSPALTKIQLYVIPNIFNLYKKLKEIRKEPDDYAMDILLSKEYAFTFRLMKKVG